MRNIVILGSTGSIGENALRVVEALPGRFRVVGLAVDRNAGRVLEQARRFGVSRIAVADPVAARQCAASAPAGVNVLQGAEGVAELAAMEGVDTVLCAIVGMAGLVPVLAALERGTNVALATKEVLVAAGGIVMNTAAKHGARVLPVDSEHSAAFQCIEGKPLDSIKRILLTASGGPFRDEPAINFDKVTVAEALAHPTWNMGKKISIDSATLMNKGLEVMEAARLFGVPLDAVGVVIHPECIVHSIVEFVDGTMMAQMSLPDMRFAVQYALTYPERVCGSLPALDLTAMGPLHFRAPDENKFPCLRLAREAASRDGTMPAVLNAANEVAVGRFLNGAISFSGIWRTVARVMEKHVVVQDPSLQDVIAADAWARSMAETV